MGELILLSSITQSAAIYIFQQQYDEFETCTSTKSI